MFTQLSRWRMLRGPQFLNWACPVRVLLQQRDCHIPALSQYATATASHSSKYNKRRRSTRCHQTRSQVCTSSFNFKGHSQNIKPLNDFFPKAFSSSQHVSGSFLNIEHKQWGSPANYYCTDCVQFQRRQHCYSSSDPFKLNNLCIRSNLTRCSSSLLLKHHVVIHQTRQVHKANPRDDSAWRECLSSVNEQRCRRILEPNSKLYEVEKVRRTPSLSLGKKPARWASVLVSLCSVEDEPAILFTLRSNTLHGRHKGDVREICPLHLTHLDATKAYVRSSGRRRTAPGIIIYPTWPVFAGGKSDPSDKDVVATALREAREELGINVGAEHVWGVLKPLREMTGMMVAPVLANLGPLEELSFKPNPGEVEEVFTVSLPHLCNPVNCGYTHFRTGDKYGYTLPVFRNGKHRVWGLTAVALDHSLKIICQ